MRELTKGRYRVRLAGEGDMPEVFALRARVFRGDAAAPDADAFDARAMHVMVEDLARHRLAGCFRLLALSGGAEIGSGYTAQFYGLAPLAGYRGPVLEMGRFCIHPEWRDPNILRIAWAAMSAHVEREGVEQARTTHHTGK